MQNLEKVPCLNVTRENLDAVWPTLIEKLSKCSFIGIDFVSLLCISDNPLQVLCTCFSDDQFCDFLISLSPFPHAPIRFEITKEFSGIGNKIDYSIK